MKHQVIALLIVGVFSAVVLNAQQVTLPDIDISGSPDGIVILLVMGRP